MGKSKNLQLDKNYLSFLTELKNKIRNKQVKAVLAVNKEVIALYWYIGKQILEKQNEAKWGSKLLEQLSTDLRNEFKGMCGFSIRNLIYMRNFANFYPESSIMQQAVAQLPWGHIIVLLEKFKTPKVREWYAQKAFENGWSRSVLLMQIESQLFERQALKEKTTSFKKTLPPIQSDFAEKMFKDPYCFDFLTIGDDAKEREIEKSLIEHIRNFLLELGQGFSFVGSQVPIDVGGEEFFIDLLFYHIKLKSYIVIELKAVNFKPEHTGQLSFYMSAIDNQLCDSNDNKTIGILLCKKKNKIVAEYALQGVIQPIGISEYQLTKAIPDNLKTSLPTIEELESELNEDNSKL
jgi:predicted nuclease of restriction endonuclease-like (RecB) superfamily